jgi:hypothetical protein
MKTSKQRHTPKATDLLERVEIPEGTALDEGILWLATRVFLVRRACGRVLTDEFGELAATGRPALPLDEHGDIRGPAKLVAQFHGELESPLAAQATFRIVPVDDRRAQALRGLRVQFTETNGPYTGLAEGLDLHRLAVEVRGRPDLVQSDQAPASRAWFVRDRGSSDGPIIDEPEATSHWSALVVYRNLSADRPAENPLRVYQEAPRRIGSPVARGSSKPLRGRYCLGRSRPPGWHDQPPRRRASSAH